MMNYTLSVQNVLLVCGWRFPLQLGVELVFLNDYSTGQHSILAMGVPYGPMLEPLFSSVFKDLLLGPL